MAVFFRPSDIVTRICTVGNMTKGGSAFAVCEDGEQVFISPKIVEATNIDVGDMLTAYCIDNYRDQDGGEERYAVRWRAIRVTVEERFSTVPPVAPVAAPVAPVAPVVPVAIDDKWEDRAVSLLKKQDRAWTATQMALEVGVHRQTVSNWFSYQHKTGKVASAKIYAQGDQERPSIVYYARDVDILNDLIDEVVLE